MTDQNRMYERAKLIKSLAIEMLGHLICKENVLKIGQYFPNTLYLETIEMHINFVEV